MLTIRVRPQLLNRADQAGSAVSDDQPLGLQGAGGEVASELLQGVVHEPRAVPRIDHRARRLAVPRDASARPRKPSPSGGGAVWASNSPSSEEQANIGSASTQIQSRVEISGSTRRRGHREVHHRPGRADATVGCPEKHHRQGRHDGHLQRQRRRPTVRPECARECVWDRPPLEATRRRPFASDSCAVRRRRVRSSQRRTLGWRHASRTPAQG